MEARATVVARGGDDQDAAPGAIADHVGQQRMGSARRGELSAADVNDVGALLYGLGDGPCEIELRTELNRLLTDGLKNRHENASAERREARHESVVLAEDHAGDVGTVLAGWPAVGRPRHQGFHLREVRKFQTRVRAVNRAVQDCNAHRGIAAGLGPEFSESGEDVHDDTTVRSLKTTDHFHDTDAEPLSHPEPQQRRRSIGCIARRKQDRKWHRYHKSSEDLCPAFRPRLAVFPNRNSIPRSSPAP